MKIHEPMNVSCVSNNFWHDDCRLISFVAEGQTSSWGGRGPSPVRSSDSPRRSPRSRRRASPQRVSSSAPKRETRRERAYDTASESSATTTPSRAHNENGLSTSSRLRSNKQRQHEGVDAYHETSTRVGGGGECARDLSYI